MYRTLTGRPGSVRPGNMVEIGQFGRPCYWTGNDPMTMEVHDLESRDYGGKTVYYPVASDGICHLGIQWDWSRHIHQVVVSYADSEQVPDEAKVQIQYWNRVWPAENHGHWTNLDDEWNGSWIKAHAVAETVGNKVIYTFDPLDITELPKAADFAVFYRKAVQMRLVFDGVCPPIECLEIYSDSVWQQTVVKLDLPENAAGYSVEAFGGFIEEPVCDGNGMTVKVWYASDGRGIGEQTYVSNYPDHAYTGRWPYEGGSPDRTVVTVHGEPSFSFLPGDIAAGKVIEAPDLGVRIEPKDKDEIEPKYGIGSERTSGTGNKSIYDLVESYPEQSYENAVANMPKLDKTKQEPWGRYVCLGCDANRQEFALRFNGHVYLNKRELKVVKRDTAKLLWPGEEIRYRFGTGDPVDFRERDDATKQRLVDGCLPIVISEWWDRGIAFEQTAYAALIQESPDNEDRKRGDEPTALIMRFKIRNTTPEVRTAKFWFVVEPGEYLSYDDGRVQAMGRYVPDNTVQRGFVQSPYAKPRMRAFMDTKGRGHARPMPCATEPKDSDIRVGAILYEVELKGREAHVIDLTIPFETYTEALEQDTVAAMDFDKKMTEMVSYWRKVIGTGAELDVPEQVITDFCKAVIPHIAITVDKDVDTGLYMVPAATYRYNVCSNEACMQIHMLDLLGHHERARKYLETFLKCQGTRPLHGRFRTSEGVFHGLRVSDDFDYQTFNYNLDHGWVMYTCAEHYRLTGDREWLKKWAPNLVAAADFVTRERKATMRYEDGEKVWEYGLLPAGHLEDNPEWFYWYSVNGYTWRGMQAVGEVLAEIDWPDARRILDESAAYKRDILTAMKRSRTLAPLVPLRDGTYIPHHPTRAYIRARDLGWIRENLYGPMHLIQTGVIADDSQEATWILKDYEDNLFVNPAFSRFVDVEKDWFSQGGMTIQAHLLYVPLIYLRRNQIKHAVRAYFNAFASHLYPDVRCFTEHAVRELGIGVGPFYKTPDEAGSVTWLRHLLVYEQGERLRLGWGVPRYWLTDGKSVTVDDAPTHFGTVAYSINSKVLQKKVEVNLTPPQRTRPQYIEVRIRHPEGAAIKDISIAGSDSYEIDRDNECIRLLDWGDQVQMIVAYQ